MAAMIVIVDDDPGMRRTLIRVLSELWPSADVQAFSSLDQLRRAALNPANIGGGSV